MCGGEGGRGGGGERGEIFSQRRQNSINNIAQSDHDNIKPITPE